VEERIRREIDLALGADRADPTDRPRRHDRLERVVGQAVVVLGGFVEHVRSRPSNHSHLPKRVTMSASGGRGRSSGGVAGRPMWMKPAIFSCGARPSASSTARSYAYHSVIQLAAKPSACAANTRLM